MIRDSTICHQWLLRECDKCISCLANFNVTLPISEIGESMNTGKIQ